MSTATLSATDVGRAMQFEGTKSKSKVPRAEAKLQQGQPIL